MQASRSQWFSHLKPTDTRKQHLKRPTWLRHAPERVAVKPSRPGLGIGLQHLDFQCMGMIETKTCILLLHPFAQHFDLKGKSPQRCAMGHVETKGIQGT